MKGEDDRRKILKGMGEREMRKGNRPGFETMTLLRFGARLRSRLIDTSSANITKHEGNVHAVRLFFKIIKHFCTNG